MKKIDKKEVRRSEQIKKKFNNFRKFLLKYIVCK